jgi:catechol-2,3-dioxygenase
MNMMQRANDALGIGIGVSNIDASLKFYQETLGLEFTLAKTGRAILLMEASASVLQAISSIQYRSMTRATATPIPRATVVEAHIH